MRAGGQGARWLAREAAARTVRRSAGGTIVAEKSRLTRKEIKQPDALVVMSGEAVGWARSHQQQVIWGAVAAVVLIAIVGIATAYRSAQRRDANVDLARAMNLLEQDPAAATPQLREVAARWSGSSVAAVAELLAAQGALRTGDADGALASIAAVEVGELPPYLQQQRLVAWGAALASKGQWAEAAEKFQEAAAMSGPYAGEALVSEARAREQAGEPDKARELFRQAYEQYPHLPDRELLATKFRSQPAAAAPAS